MAVTPTNAPKILSILCIVGIVCTAMVLSVRILFRYRLKGPLGWDDAASAIGSVCQNPVSPKAPLYIRYIFLLIYDSPTLVRWLPFARVFLPYSRSGAGLERGMSSYRQMKLLLFSRCVYKTADLPTSHPHPLYYIANKCSPKRRIG